MGNFQNAKKINFNKLGLENEVDDKTLDDYVSKFGIDRLKDVYSGLYRTIIPIAKQITGAIVESKDLVSLRKRVIGTQKRLSNVRKQEKEREFDDALDMLVSNKNIKDDDIFRKSVKKRYFDGTLVNGTKHFLDLYFSKFYGSIELNNMEKIRDLNSVMHDFYGKNDKGFEVFSRLCAKYHVNLDKIDSADKMVSAKKIVNEKIIDEVDKRMLNFFRKKINEIYERKNFEILAKEIMTLYNTHTNLLDDGSKINMLLDQSMTYEKLIKEYNTPERFEDIHNICRTIDREFFRLSENVEAFQSSVSLNIAVNGKVNLKTSLVEGLDNVFNNFRYKNSITNSQLGFQNLMLRIKGALTKPKENIYEIIDDAERMRKNYIAGKLSYDNLRKYMD